MKGLAEKTSRIIDKVALMESIKPYVLVGGTALSLQIGTRLSEDLDFMKWRQTRNEKPEVKWAEIERELSAIGKIESRDLLDIDHVEFVVDGVKISFYSSGNYTPVQNVMRVVGNLVAADPISIGMMKMEVMLRRSKFRDYYDIYSLIKAGYDITEMIEGALAYSRHRLKTKNLLAMLTNGARFTADSSFKALEPVYDVGVEEIEALIKEKLIENKSL